MPNLWMELEACYDEIDYLRACLRDDDDLIDDLILENWILRFANKNLREEIQNGKNCENHSDGK